jgi:16S rRNA (adenine1518-N6/adenine1519-N6)-dimethyltransferase
MGSYRHVLKARGLAPKKSLGQNFLNEPATAERIARHTGAGKDDVVLEIGAGMGALTTKLGHLAGQVIAVETDRRITPILRSELLANGRTNVEVVEADILRVRIPDLVPADSGKIVVAGNLPYHISSQIIVALIDNRQIIDRAVIMIQKELAERLTATPGGKPYGRLTAMLDYCAETRPLMDVGAKQFHPKPKVDSTVIGIQFIDPVPFPATDEKFLFSVIKAAFGKRRKTLKNAIAGGGLGISPVIIGEALEAADIDPTRRAETVNAEEFVSLSNELHVRQEAESA